jgi:hypothetical protein
MGRQVNKLSSRTAATMAAPGRHSDGSGLYLNISASGAKSWVFLYNAAGRRREMGLRFLADMPAALAFPPMRPSATAAAFLPSSVVTLSAGLFSPLGPRGIPHLELLSDKHILIADGNPSLAWWRQ